MRSSVASFGKSGNEQCFPEASYSGGGGFAEAVVGAATMLNGGWDVGGGIFVGDAIIVFVRGVWQKLELMGMLDIWRGRPNYQIQEFITLQN